MQFEILRNIGHFRKESSAALKSDILSVHELLQQSLGPDLQQSLSEMGPGYSEVAEFLESNSMSGDQIKTKLSRIRVESQMLDQVIVTEQITML